MNPRSLIESKVKDHLTNFEGLAGYAVLLGQTAEDRDIPAVIVYAESMDIPADLPYDVGNYVIRLSIHVITSADDENLANPDALARHQEAVDTVYNRMGMVYALQQSMDAEDDGILYDCLFGSMDEGKDGARNFGTLLKYEVYFCLPA